MVNEENNSIKNVYFKLIGYRYRYNYALKLNDFGVVGAMKARSFAGGQKL